MRSRNVVWLFAAAISAVVFSNCRTIARSSASREVADDSALFELTVRTLRDSVGSVIRVVPEPLSEGTLGRISSEHLREIRNSRERWLRSAGFLSESTYEPCTGIFVIGQGKEGCPTTQISIARISPVSGSGERRVLGVSVRSLAPAGSSEEKFHYVFARHGGVWMLVAIERGAVIE